MLYILTSVWVLRTTNAGRNCHFQRFLCKKPKKSKKFAANFSIKSLSLFTCWWCLGDMKVFDVIQSWIWGTYPTSRYWYLLIPTPVSTGIQGLACVGGLGGWVFFLLIGFAFSLLAWLPSVLACTCTLVEPKNNIAQFVALAKCKLRLIDSHLKDIFLLRLSVKVSN